MVTAGLNKGTLAQGRSFASLLPLEPFVTVLFCTVSPSKIRQSVSAINQTNRLSDRAHFNDFGDVMPQHIFDAHFQSSGRTRTSLARSLHLQHNNAILKAPIHNVAAIHSDGRPYPGIQQFFDLFDYFRVLAILAMVGMYSAHLRRFGYNRLA